MSARPCTFGACIAAIAPHAIAFTEQRKDAATRRSRKPCACMGERMPAVGLSEAAKLTGRNQSTIHRAMKMGRLAFTVADSGERRIDVAELERAFGLKGSARPDAIAQPIQSNAVQAGELAALQRL